MKSTISPFIKILAFTCYCCSMCFSLKAQPKDCVFQNPVITIHFGSGNVQDINKIALSNYAREYGSCPTDGYYSYVPATSNCFQGDWFVINKDHTPGASNGNMMLVNASPEGGMFFKTIITALKANTIYELAAWLMNVCRMKGGCAPLPPRILMILTTVSGKKIQEFQTGEIAQTYEPKWSQYKGTFTMPAGETSLVLTMADLTIGGCGNDFALDDITFRECIISKPAAIPRTLITAKRKLNKDLVFSKKPLLKNEAPKELPGKNKEQSGKIKTEIKNAPLTLLPEPKRPSTIFAPVPEILKSRVNIFVRQIITDSEEIRIDLYDNGIVDGDTITVYHNNEVVISRAMLSEKPITLRIKVDVNQPHHEIVMVANNLGSIPPNTALMIVTTKEKRYEVFISTTEQSNAKVVIDLKK